MIYGIGIDIIEVERIRKAINKNSNFKKKIFTKKEIAYCESHKNSAQCFAARFACKEAFVKALGIGLRKGINFSDIEIENNEIGKPFMKTYKNAEKIIKRENINNIHVSLSHIKNFTNAIVLLEI